MPKASLKREFGFTRAELTVLLSTLNDLIQKGPKERHQGICFNWTLRMPASFLQKHGGGSLYNLIGKLAMGWPHSRDPSYDTWSPVPLTSGDMWTHKGLELRLSLMRYVAHRLRGWLRRTPR